MRIKVTFTGYNANVISNIIRVYKVAPFGQPDGITEDTFTAKGQLIGFNGTVVVAIPASAANGYVPIADTTQASGIRWGIPSVSVEDTTNNVINGGFDFAERQTPGTDTTITDEKYSADRWRCTRENADLQYSRQDASSESGLTSRYYGKFTKITNAGKFAIYQPLEFRDSIPLRGRDVIFQVQMRASSAKTIKIAIIELEAAGTADTLPAAFVSAWNVDSTDPTLGSNLAVVDSVQSCNVTTSWQNFSVTGTIPSDSKNLILAIWSDADFSAADWLGLAEAGLYRGSTTQTWAPRTESEELNLCRFYGQRLLRSDDSAIMNLGVRQGGQSIHSPLQFSNAMRIAPTITDNITAWASTNPTTTQAASYVFASGGFITITGALTVNVDNANKNSARLVFQAATSFSGSAGELCDIRLGPDVIIFADAEL